MITDLTTSDWKRLIAMRDRFLTDASGEYWGDTHDVELYDLVFAQRIGWKWDAVLASLDTVAWKPRSKKILDWGCGSGVAARAVVDWSGIQEVTVVDKSHTATRYAVARLADRQINARIQSPDEPIAAGTLLLISHVIGELADPATLARVAAQADEVIWVEPGTHEHSRSLGAQRAVLQAAGHHILAPCTHENICPMFQSENARHWCHFFASTPPEIFQSQFWHDVSRRLEIDLRSLPYSFLAGSRLDPSTLTTEAERLIGRPVELKAHCKLLCCGQSGLAERTLQKRDDPALYRSIVKKGLTGLFSWEVDTEKNNLIKCGKSLT